MKAVHGVSDYRHISPEDIVNNGKALVSSSDLEVYNMTDEKRRRLELEQQYLNFWRTDPKCLKSLFSIIPPELQEVIKKRNMYSYISFSKQ